MLGSNSLHSGGTCSTLFLWRYSLFDGFPKLKRRSLTSCVQDGLCLGSTWLLLLCEMQRWLQNSFLRLKLSLYLLSPNTCGNTLVLEGSISLFSKGIAGKQQVSFKTSQYSESLIESQDSLGWKGPYRSSRSNPPAMGRDILHQTRLLKASSSLAWNTSRDQQEC